VEQAARVEEVGVDVRVAEPARAGGRRVLDLRDAIGDEVYVSAISAET
jgi:hypothetical protein